MDWDNLRFFLAIARHGTLLDAARWLDCDHSTLSRRLSLLESAVGEPLFDRAGRRLRITQAGEKLRKTAEKVEATLIKDLAEIGEARTIRAGSVTIGSPEGLGIGYLAEVLAELAEPYPEISVELVALPRNFSLAAREVDIAITLDRPSSGDLIYRKLTEYTLRFFGTSSYLERHPAPKTADELERHRLCGYIDQLLHTDELNYMRSFGSALRPHLKSSSIIAQMNMIAGGRCIGVLPDFLAAREGKFVPILPKLLLRRNYWIAVHSDLKGLSRVRLILDAVIDRVGADRDRFAPS